MKKIISSSLVILLAMPFLFAQPIRNWGTYYGGTIDDYGQSCATDQWGNVYLAGETGSSSSVATSGAFQTTFAGGGYDTYLVKFNSAGVRQWATYYGGSGDDRGNACTVDPGGNVYLAGWTSSSSSIASAGSYQTASGGGIYDAFLVKFNSSGARQWATYFGGPADDRGFSCSADLAGNVYVAGQTMSASGIATAGAHQTSNGGGADDAFLVKFSSAGVLQWATYYGNTGDDGGYTCATDQNQNIYLGGLTSSASGTAIATPGAHQTSIGGGVNVTDAFLVKFNSAGARQWGTYYGGTSFEYGYGCATDLLNNVYLTGNAASAGSIATAGSHQSAKGGLQDAFLVQFNSAGVRQWGTYYGGPDQDETYGCATDANNNVYISGWSISDAAIATAGAHQSINNGSFLGTHDAFIAKFNSGGIRQWGTYYGDVDEETGYSCAADMLGNVYLAGGTISTTSSIISTAGAHQTAFGGGMQDAFLVQFGASVLNVELLSFTGYNENQYNVLEWVTATEVNNDYFIVERKNGTKSSWMEAGTVNAAGNSSGDKEYSFTDMQAGQGISYYRLREVGYDGGISFSPVIRVDAGQLPAVLVFPNPAAEKLHYVFPAKSDDAVVCQVTDILGNVVLKEMTRKEGIVYCGNISISRIPQGAYFLNVGDMHTPFIKR